MNDKTERGVQDGCCLLMILLFVLIAVGLGYGIIAGLGAITRMF